MLVLPTSPPRRLDAPSLWVGVRDHVGFTGTRAGMTPHQRMEVERALRCWWQEGARWFHHGDCLGADAEAHAVALAVGYQIVLHPARGTRFRAHCADATITVASQEFLDRNRAIVDAVSMVLAVPRDREERKRSGTWMTIRYARANRVPCLVVLPQALEPLRELPSPWPMR